MKIEAKTRHDASKQGNGDQHKKKMTISGIATYVGPDVYALPSVELSETKDVSGRVLCVLPFSDYLHLRKVSMKDRVVMGGRSSNIFITTAPFAISVSMVRRTSSLVFT